MKALIRMISMFTLLTLIIGSICAQISEGTDFRNYGSTKSYRTGIGSTGNRTAVFDGTGDGIFGRQPVEGRVPENLLRQNGKITMKVCIDREGRATFVSIINKGTTIKDKGILKEALKAISGYIWEEDYTAAREQCGLYSFNFKK